MQLRQNRNLANYLEQMTIHLEICKTPTVSVALATGQEAGGKSSHQLAEMQVDIHSLWLTKPGEVHQSAGILTNSSGTMGH